RAPYHFSGGAQAGGGLSTCFLLQTMRACLSTDYLHRGLLGKRGARGQKGRQTPGLRGEIIPRMLPKAEADALNRASRRVYANTLVWHDRVYRRTGHWLFAKRRRTARGLAGWPHAPARPQSGCRPAGVSMPPARSPTPKGGWAWRAAIPIGVNT